MYRKLRPVRSNCVWLLQSRMQLSFLCCLSYKGTTAGRAPLAVFTTAQARQPDTYVHSKAHVSATRSEPAPCFGSCGAGMRTSCSRVCTATCAGKAPAKRWRAPSVPTRPGARRARPRSSCFSWTALARRRVAAGVQCMPLYCTLTLQTALCCVMNCTVGYSAWRAHWIRLS